MTAFDAPLYAEVAGPKHAPPMLFVHPHPMDNSCWLFQTAHFSTWYRTTAVDLPGYGRSRAFIGDLSMRALSQACWEAVSDERPAVLVGCSVGSTLAQHMYHLAPERTAALILCGTGYNPTKDFVARRIAGYRDHGIDYRRGHVLEDFSPAFRTSALAQWFADVFTERNATSDVKGIIAIFEAMGAPDPDWLQHDLHAPVLILTGSEDKTHPRAFALRDRLPDARLITIEGAGHACHIEQPATFNTEVLRFLDGLGLLPDPTSPAS